MTEVNFNKEQLHDAFNRSLLETIVRRRSRRFPVGCSIPDEAVFKHSSLHPPVPLSDTELAILCYSAAGITGAITCEPLFKEPGNSILSWVGHATPNPCNVPTTKLFFTNDNGTFLYDPKVKEDTKPVEIETKSDREKILTSFMESCSIILDHRVTMHGEHLHKSITWNTNQPGTTVFIPVVDHTEEYLNWASMVLNEEYGYQLYDDIKGGDCGLKKYIDNGDLKGPPVPLSSFEAFVWSGIILAPAYLMGEHIHLVAEALGLGSVMFGGYTGEVMLGVTSQSEGLGFRGVKDKTGRVNAVGLDGIFESYCPPYYRSMDDAVDAFFEKKFGPSSLFGADYTGLVPFEPGKWREKKPKYLSPPKKRAEIVKAYMNYIYDTYGKIPAGMSPMTIPVWVQVHHVDVEFYDKYYVKGTVTEAQRQHLKRWHT
jgi:hypothetical protein